MQRKVSSYFLGIWALIFLAGCGGTACDSSSSSSSASLAVTAPDQYPAGIATTAYLTITNTSTTAANNLVYAIPNETNHTGALITVDDASANTCRTIAANDSCTLKVAIGANSTPGSFTVVATSTAQANQSIVNQVKTLVGLNAQKFALTANIGLTDIPSNTNSGANGISFLVAPTVAAESDGSAQVAVVAIVNQNAGSNFNTINLTTQTGQLLDFTVLSGNSGSNIPTNLKPGDVVTYLLKIPAGASSPYSFYAQTKANDVEISQGTVATNIMITNVKQGILIVQPTGFNLSLAESYTSQILTYSNTGTATINGLTIQTPQAPLTISKNNCASSLDAGKSCTVTVVSNAELGSSGNGSIVANFTGGADVISNYTYSGGNIQNGLVLSAINNFTFSATTGNSTATTKLTLQNNGNINESNFVISFAPNQYFSLSHQNNDTCILSGNTITNTLASGQSCVITLEYTNANVSAGLTTLNVNYNYNAQSASTSQLLAYQTTQGGATLTITPTNYNYGAIVANNVESKVHTFTATNAGVESISAITFQAMTGDSSYFTVESSGVGGCASALPLANGASCTFKVRFGPTATTAQSIDAVLPVAYTFSSGSSSTSVSLSGYARTPLSANIILNNVSATGATSGNGESANSAYQFESSTLNSDLITLSYSNTGATNASNFTIAQAPSGYAIATNNCNGVTLQANSANTCNVTLMPNQAIAGALNINLASSLQASWSDESANVTGRTILWNTTNGTQNIIYANVYASAQVTAIMSRDSAGLIPLTNVKTNESFYIVLKLTGGANVTTTYNVSVPSDFVANVTTCAISSNSPICNVAFTAPNSASTGNVINITGGAPTTIPTAFTFNVVAPTMYAYISNGTQGVFQCTVSATDGSLGCLTPSTRPNGSLDALSAIVNPTGSYLYVLTNDNTSPGSYITCALGSHGTYESSNCVTKTFPPYGNLAFAATGDNWFAYLAGAPTSNTGNNPNYCTVFQESSLFCNVAGTTPTNAAKGVTSIVVNGSSLVYLSGTNTTDSPYNAKISVCDVTNNAGYTNCRAAYGSMSITNPTSLSTVQIGSDYYVYVLDYGVRVAYCKIETTGADKGKFIDDTGCNYIDSSFLDVTNGVQSITTVNLNGSPYLYVPSQNEHTINICPLNPDGGIDDYVCNPYVPDSSIIPSYIPRGISFGSFYAN